MRLSPEDQAEWEEICERMAGRDLEKPDWFEELTCWMLEDLRRPLAIGVALVLLVAAGTWTRGA